MRQVDLFEYTRGAIAEYYPFVTRMKKNLSYVIAKRHDVPKNRNILSDETIRLSGTATWQNYPGPLRRIVVWDKQKQEEIVLLTNHLDFGVWSHHDHFHL